MCGIAGFVDFRKKSTAEDISMMSACLKHRGPDGGNVFFTETRDATIGFGHRRLSIIDLSTAASQPMHYDGLHVVFNGEIYNYEEIRNQLIQKGHQFSTHSDTEVILHSWREWGVDAIHQWHGMFAIVLYDERTGEITCVRDRAGVKPLFYYNHNDVFLFSSELKSMLQHERFQKQVNKNAVASFLQYGYIPHPHCIYENTAKLPPGFLLTVNLSNREIKTEQYWNVYNAYNQPKLKIRLPEAVEETEKILTKAFQYRMVADVPIGVFLSGGYDSSCVTALLQKDRTERLKTFTIGMTDEKINEAPFAKLVAQHLGTDHIEYYCTTKEALNIIPDLPFYYDEPFADYSAVPTILVSRLAREKVTVALSADAGDEVFAGYNRYDYLMRYSKKLQSIPKPIRQAAVAVMANVSSERIPYLRNKYNFHSRYGKLKNLLNNPTPSEMLKNLTLVFSDTDIDSLFCNAITSLRTAHTSNELQTENFDSLSFLMAIDYQTYLVDDILQKVDRATMSVSLEGREPFLDQSIIEWAAQLPSDFKYYKGQKKYILKQIVHKYLPKEIMERPKMGFGIPLEKWLSEELKPLVYDYLNIEKLKTHGLFNIDWTLKLRDEFYRGRKETYLKIWNLLMFQMWYEKWIG